MTPFAQNAHLLCRLDRFAAHMGRRNRSEGANGSNRGVWLGSYTDASGPRASVAGILGRRLRDFVEP